MTDVPVSAKPTTDASWPARATAALHVTIPLRQAWMCMDCNGVNNNAMQCACSCRILHPLSTWLNR